MTTLDYEQTKLFIFFVINHYEENRMRIELYQHLQHINSNEGQFYAGIVEHGLYMKLTSQQWFVLLSRLPIDMLRSQLPLNKILSPRQLAELPPTIS